jgi:DNA (cytosine-5)-methyltransferase 1
MRYVELFCGAGGTSCGLTAAGWHCVGAVDRDADALSTYRLNFADHPVHTLDLAAPLPPELVAPWAEALREGGALVASSPCTSFSLANRMPDAQTSALTARLADLHVRALMPEWLLFENVPRAAKSAEFATFVRILEGELGYAVRHGVVAVTDLGLPQRRQRLLLLAHRTDAGRVAAAWARLEAGLAAGAARPPTSMREAFEASGVPTPTSCMYMPCCNERHRRSVFPLDAPGPTVRGKVRPFRPGYVFHPNDATQDRARVFAMTPEHAAVLQGFPPSFRWAVSATAKAKQIGNAVPPPLARALAEAVTAA